MSFGSRMVPQDRLTRRAALMAMVSAAAAASLPARRLLASNRTGMPWRTRGLVHPTPRPGITGARVLTATQLEKAPHLIELFDGIRAIPPRGNRRPVRLTCRFLPALGPRLCGIDLARGCRGAPWPYWSNRPWPAPRSAPVNCRPSHKQSMARCFASPTRARVCADDIRSMARRRCSGGEVWTPGIPSFQAPRVHRIRHGSLSFAGLLRLASIAHAQTTPTAPQRPAPVTLTTSAGSDGGVIPVRYSQAGEQLSQQVPDRQSRAGDAASACTVTR